MGAVRFGGEGGVAGVQSVSSQCGVKLLTWGHRRKKEGSEKSKTNGTHSGIKEKKGGEPPQTWLHLTPGQCREICCGQNRLLRIRRVLGTEKEKRVAH